MESDPDVVIHRDIADNRENPEMPGHRCQRSNRVGAKHALSVAPKTLHCMVHGMAELSRLSPQSV